MSRLGLLCVVAAWVLVGGFFYGLMFYPMPTLAVLSIVIGVGSTAALYSHGKELGQ